VAQALGLDEISIVPGTDAASAGGLIQVGKRLSDRIYVLLEQRLSTAGNAVKVNYQFARDWSLRLESGETDAVDVFYTFSFD
jgi:translocation and assembly module TamB